MAFYDNQEDEDQQAANAQQPGGQVQSGSSVVTGGGGLSAGGTQAPKSNSPDRPGNFVNLQQYLDANKTQSQKLGGQVSGVINNSAQDAATGISGLNDKFGEKVNQGQIANFGSAVDEGTQILNDANKGNVSGDQVNRFKDITNASYKGPNNLSEAADIYQPVTQKVDLAKTQADLSKTEPGQEQLLKGINNSTNYTPGAQRFDTYLLKNPESQKKLSDARTAADALQGQMSTADQSAAQQAEQAKTQAQVTQDTIRKALGIFDDPSTPQNEAAGALGDYQNEIAGNLSKANTDTSALTQKINSGNLSRDDLKTLGLNNMQTYGIDLKNFYQPGVATEAGVTTPEERARYNALLQLSGGDSQLYSGANEDDFGNFHPNVNSNAFNQAINDSKSLWEVGNMNNNLPGYSPDALKWAGEGGWRDHAGIMDPTDVREENMKAAIKALYNTGSITPDAMKQISDQFGGSQFAPMKKFLDYYTQLQAMRGRMLTSDPNERIGGLMPELPKSNDGSIDWSQIKKPEGK